MVIDIQALLAQKPVLMGVVNVTPDSFFDGGQFFDPEQAITHALQLSEDGAHILDIGGESTRPGAKSITATEEQDRILSVIEGVKKSLPDAIISVDTRNADTMRAALNSGAEIINDVSALTHDYKSMHVVSKAQCTVILMHMQGTPQTMQKDPNYDNVIDDVYNYLDKRVDECVENGIQKKNIILDVGFGFGKTLDHNLALFQKLDQFHQIGCPLLVGASRKSFIEKICPNTPADQRLAGSITAAIKGVEQGAQFFRIHDVKETKQAFDVWQAIQSSQVIMQPVEE